MAANVPTGPPSLADLAKGIIDDAQRLLHQEVELARSEMQKEWDKAKTAGTQLGLGAGLALVGGLLLAFVLVYLLTWLFGWSNPWGGFAIVGGVLAAAGAALLMRGGKEASEVSLVPRQAIRELETTVTEAQEKISETVSETTDQVAAAVKQTTEALTEVTHGNGTGTRRDPAEHR
jgi:hypothetical protein